MFLVLFLFLGIIRTVPVPPPLTNVRIHATVPIDAPFLTLPPTDTPPEFTLPPPTRFIPPPTSTDAPTDKPFCASCTAQIGEQCEPFDCYCCTSSCYPNASCAFSFDTGNLICQGINVCTDVPTEAPTAEPTGAPTAVPTIAPTNAPTVATPTLPPIFIPTPTPPPTRSCIAIGQVCGLFDTCCTSACYPNVNCVPFFSFSICNGTNICPAPTPPSSSPTVYTGVPTDFVCSGIGGSCNKTSDCCNPDCERTLTCYGFCAREGPFNPCPSPTNAPSNAPTTASPTNTPTTASPTSAPTNAPTTAEPTGAPTNAPTSAPTSAPTTAEPTNAPTVAPTSAPTNAPTGAPTTTEPTDAPTDIPTDAPTEAPTTGAPTTGSPTRAPTTGSPTRAPTTGSPTRAPTTGSPTRAPTTGSPTRAPTTATPTVSPTSASSLCKFCTFTQGGYGSRCRSLSGVSTSQSCKDIVTECYRRVVSPGCLRNACFVSPVILGNASLPGGHTVRFTTSRAIENYLPASGTPSVFTVSATNPSSTSAGVFGGQLLTAVLNQLFMSSNTSNLTTLRFSTGCGPVASIIRGRTVAEVIHIANQVISGGSSTLYSAFTPAILNVALTLYNEGFENCKEVVNVTCFECVNNNDDIIHLNLGVVSPVTSTGTEIVYPGLFIGIIVFIAFMVMLIIAIQVCLWYFRRNKVAKLAKFNKM